MPAVMLGSEVPRSTIQRFVVVGELGSGTMGTVYRARDPELERDVAIKVLAKAADEVRDALSSHDTVDLRGGGDGRSDELLSEARIMARLSHPNVLPVYEVGLADGQVFIVMEHIAGTDLRTWLDTPRATGEILGMFARAARGLEAAHKRGIVHGDFKPENVLVGDDGRARVADFGLSRLVSAQRPLVQLERAVGGTPFYMAPELWNGAPASAASDVFALCTAIVEALGAEPDKPGKRDLLDRALRVRGCDRQLRRAVIAGAAEEPAARVTIGALIAALAPRSRRQLAVYLACGAAGLLGLVSGVVVQMTSKEPCVADAIQLPGAWAESRIAALKALEIDDEFERDRARLTTAKRDACTAENRGEITTAQARMWASCLERNIIALDAVAQSIEAVGDKQAAYDAFHATREVKECKDVAAPPLPADRTRVAASYLRLANAFAVPFGSNERLREFAAVESDARELGEIDLAARAAILLGMRQIETDQLRAADESLGRAYRDAIAIHDNRTVISALVKRAVAATRYGDSKGARSYGQLAVDITERPGTPPEEQSFVYYHLAQVELDLDAERAVALAEKTLALFRAHDLDDPEMEGDVRNIMIEALGQLGGGREVRALALARENLENSRKLLGEDHFDHAMAINVLATALRRNGKLSEALASRRHALAVMVKAVPADHSMILVQRGSIASDLMKLGQFAAACEELSERLAVANRNEALRAEESEWRADLGLCKFEQGKFVEGLRMYNHGLDGIVALHGPTHLASLDYRTDQIELELEAGELELAEDHGERLAHDFQSSNRFPLMRAKLEGAHRARVALALGRAAEAEQRVRAGLAAWAELHGNESGRRLFLRTLAQSLVAQRRWRDAAAAVDAASAITDWDRADELAKLDVVRAQVLAGQGQVQAAREVARRARAVLESFPSARLARADADALLKARR